MYLSYSKLIKIIVSVRLLTVSYDTIWTAYSLGGFFYLIHRYSRLNFKSKRHIRGSLRPSRQIPCHRKDLQERNTSIHVPVNTTFLLEYIFYFIYYYFCFRFVVVGIQKDHSDCKCNGLLHRF